MQTSQIRCWGFLPYLSVEGGSQWSLQTLCPTSCSPRTLSWSLEESTPAALHDAGAMVSSVYNFLTCPAACPWSGLYQVIRFLFNTQSSIHPSAALPAPLATVVAGVCQSCLGPEGGVHTERQTIINYFVDYFRSFLQFWHCCYFFANSNTISSSL